MKRALALLALIATPALAASSVADYAACVHKLTGLPVPATPPRVIYSDEWSEPVNAMGMCCDEHGSRVYAANSRGFSPTSYSSYYRTTRTIIIYRSARPSALVHEMAADAYVQATGYLDPLKREAVGYDAEKRAPFECEGLE